jgi:hypothetical protein
MPLRLVRETVPTPRVVDHTACTKHRRRRRWSLPPMTWPHLEARH